MRQLRHSGKCGCDRVPAGSTPPKMADVKSLELGQLGKDISEEEDCVAGIFGVQCEGWSHGKLAATGVGMHTDRQELQLV